MNTAVFNQFKDPNKATHNYLAESCELDLSMFFMVLCYAEKNENIEAEDWDDIISQYMNLSNKVQKALEFAKLCKYATGFDIPEDKEFQLIDIEALQNKS